MDRAFANFSIKAVSEDRREFEGWASTPTTDRQNDQLMPEGARFQLPLPFLLDHDHTRVVGEVYRAEVNRAGIRFWARIRKIAEPGPAQELCDLGWQLIKNKLRPVVSVGFRPLQQERIEGGGLRFTSWEWLELSGVAVAAQPEAKITAAKSVKSDAVVNGRPRTHLPVVKLDPTVRALMNGTLKIHTAPRNQSGKPFKIHKIRTRPPVVKLSPEECPWLNAPRKPHPVVKLSPRSSGRFAHRVVRLRQP